MACGTFDLFCRYREYKDNKAASKQATSNYLMDTIPDQISDISMRNALLVGAMGIGILWIIAK